MLKGFCKTCGCGNIYGQPIEHRIPTCLGKIEWSLTPNQMQIILGSKEFDDWKFKKGMSHSGYGLIELLITNPFLVASILSESVDERTKNGSVEDSPKLDHRGQVSNR